MTPQDLLRAFPAYNIAKDRENVVKLLNLLKGGSSGGGSTGGTGNGEGSSGGERYKWLAGSPEFHEPYEVLTQIFSPTEAQQYQYNPQLSYLWNPQISIGSPGSKQQSKQVADLTSLLKQALDQKGAPVEISSGETGINWGLIALILSGGIGAYFLFKGVSKK
ncbi:MAG: hypothetical protein EFT35_07770 [Methanophagales archaeon ANME-1-THS]|nr:MAG: hypothetical protein EFT35_07770 [Methanophagales archaeon ANME-1-THS]